MSKSGGFGVSCATMREAVIGVGDAWRPYRWRCMETMRRFRTCTTCDTRSRSYHPLCVDILHPRGYTYHQWPGKDGERAQYRRGALRESSAPQKPRRRACEFIENASKVRGSLTILPYELMKETIDLNHAANEVLLLHGINAQLVQETPAEVGRSSIMP